MNAKDEGWKKVNQMLREKVTAAREQIIRDMVKCDLNNQSLLATVEFGGEVREAIVEEYYQIPSDQREELTWGQLEDFAGYLRAISMMISFRDWDSK